jgi:hypothetical protein
MPSRLPRVYQPTRRERIAHFRQQYTAFLVAGLLGVALFAGALAINLERTATMWRDTADSPLLSGQATVSQIRWSRDYGSTPWGYDTVELTFQGQSLWTHAATSFYNGQHVILHYRIGKSGLLYPVNVSN